MAGEYSISFAPKNNCGFGNRSETACQGTARLYAVKAKGEFGYSSMLCKHHAEKLKKANIAKMQLVASKDEGNRTLRAWRK